MHDIPLLKFLSSKDNFDRFRKHVKSHTVVRETELILNDYDTYWKLFPDNTSIDFNHFAVWFRMVQHSSWDAERYSMYATIFEKIEAEPPVDKSIVDKFIELDYIAQARDVCDKVIRGEPASITEVQPLLDRYLDEVGKAGKSDEDYFVTNNIASILDDLIRSHGLEWRIEDLNVAVGPVHAGDFIIIGARPETGKTTFVCSEFTHMAQQLPAERKAIIFNNEEDGRKIFIRLIQACLDATILDISIDEKKAEDKYVTALGSLDRIKVVDKENDLSIYDIERYLKQGDYGLVGINILDKVRGFDRDDSEVSRMRKLAQFVRNLAKKYKTTIFAVMQADASGEGKAWLDLSQLYGTKTGVQGEADVILMIGAAVDDHDTRYIHVAKNKLPGGPRTVASKRHDKFETRFDPERARYASKYL